MTTIKADCGKRLEVINDSNSAEKREIRAEHRCDCHICRTVYHARQKVVDINFLARGGGKKLLMSAALIDGMDHAELLKLSDRVRHSVITSDGSRTEEEGITIMRQLYDDAVRPVREIGIDPKKVGLRCAW